MKLGPKSAMMFVIPATLLCTVLVLTGLLWWNLDQHQETTIAQHIQIESEQISRTIAKDFARRVQSLQWFVNTWEQRKEMSESEFNSLMSALLTEYPGYQAIQWVDSNLHMQWFVPQAGNEELKNMLINRNDAFGDERRIALEHARHMNTPTMTPVLSLKQGDTGFVLYFPIHLQGSFHGFLVATFRVERWLDYVLQTQLSITQRQYFDIAVRIDNTPIFSTAARRLPFADQASSNAFFQMDHKFTVTCAPRLSMIQNEENYLPEIAAGAGALLALLISFVSFVMLKNQQEKNYIHEEKLALETKAAEQEVTQQTFHQQSGMQRILMNIATNYINIPTESIGPAIHKALGEMALFVSADRAYVYEYDWDTQTASSAYEWCQFGISPQHDKMQHVSFASIEDWVHAHQQGLPIQINAVSELPAGGLRTILERQKVQSLLAVPLLHEQDLLGFVGFDWVKSLHQYTDVELNLLKLFGEILVNIHQRSKADQRLIESQQRMDLALRGTNSGLWDWHVPSGHVIFNDRWAEIVGYTLAELEPLSIATWEKLCHADDLKHSEQLLLDHFEGKNNFYECEARMKHKNGQWVWVLDRGKVVEWDNAGQPIRMTGTHLDITELKRAQAQLQHLATHDELTGLPTRRLAQDRGEMSIQRAKRNNSHTAFLFVDLDGFKPVNDHYGHDAGDQLLKIVASRLLTVTRNSDTVSRVGGDEFLIILDACKDKADARRVARDILQELTVPIQLKEQISLSIGCSIGVAMYPFDGNEFNYLVHQADWAMYYVKETGKNSYHFAHSVPARPSA